MLYGSSKLIIEYISKGDSGYKNIKKVYSVNIVYFALGQGADYVYYWKTEFRGLHKRDDILRPSKRQQEDFAIETISDIYPEYYILRVNQFNDIAKNSLDEWIYFLKNEEIKSDFKAKGLTEAKEILDIMKLDEKARAIYKRKEENKMYKNSLLYTARLKGIEEEKKNSKKKIIEIAKNLLLANMDIEFISKTTGLSVEEIEELKDL